MVPTTVLVYNTAYFIEFLNYNHLFFVIPVFSQKKQNDPCRNLIIQLIIIILPITWKFTFQMRIKYPVLPARRIPL